MFLPLSRTRRIVSALNSGAYYALDLGIGASISPRVAPQVLMCPPNRVNLNLNPQLATVPSHRLLDPCSGNPMLVS